MATLGDHFKVWVSVGLKETLSQIKIVPSSQEDGKTTTFIISFDRTEARQCSTKVRWIKKMPWDFM